MIDAIHVQKIQGLGDIAGRALLTGMNGDVKTQFPAPGEDPGKLFRRVAVFRRIQPEAIQSIQERPGELQGFKGTGFGEVTQE